MFVFRVFDHIAYALVMTAIGPIKVGDRFSLPDRSDSASSPTRRPPFPSPSHAETALLAAVWQAGLLARDGRSPNGVPGCACR